MLHYLHRWSGLYILKRFGLFASSSKKKVKQCSMKKMMIVFLEGSIMKHMPPMTVQFCKSSKDILVGQAEEPCVMISNYWYALKILFQYI